MLSTYNYIFAWLIQFQRRMPFTMIGLDVIIQACSLFATIRTPFLHNFFSQMCLHNVLLQVVAAVCGIRALVAELVLHALVYELHVLFHLISSGKLFSTVYTGNFLPLNWASTVCGAEMPFQILEDFTTKFTGLDGLRCVPVFEMKFHFPWMISFEIAHCTLNRFIVIVSPANVKV